MKNNIKKSRFWEMLKQGLKSFFTKNIAIKVLSLMFAILLWGYVLMTQNPPRVKTVTDVTVSIEGEADLTTRKLTLRGGSRCAFGRCFRARKDGAYFLCRYFSG